MKRKVVPKRTSPKHARRVASYSSGSSGEITLTAAEFQHHEKDEYWYIGMTVLLALFLILFIRAGDYLLAAVVLAAAVAIFRLANLKPVSRTVRLSERGLYWGDTFYPIHKLRSFWITRVKDRYNVYLERVGLSPAVHFVVSDTKAADLVAFLSSHLPYHDQRGEPLPDRLNRLLRL